MTHLNQVNEEIIKKQTELIKELKEIQREYRRNKMFANVLGMVRFKNWIMDREKFNSLVVAEKSRWLEDAKRRQRWRWLNRLTLKPRIKYYIMRRKFLKLFIHIVSIFVFFPMDLLQLQLTFKGKI